MNKLLVAKLATFVATLATLVVKLLIQKDNMKILVIIISLSILAGCQTGFEGQRWAVGFSADITNCNPRNNNGSSILPNPDCVPE